MATVFGIIGGKYLKSVPFDFAEQFQDSAIKNHAQGIDRLNQRGGLSPREFYCIMQGIPLTWAINESAESAILVKVAEWLRKNNHPPARG